MIKFELKKMIFHLATQTLKILSNTVATRINIITPSLDTADHTSAGISERCPQTSSWGF